MILNLVLNISTAVDDRPEVRFLNRYVRERLCAKGPQAWIDLGRELLGVESSDALDVLKNNHGDVTNCCSAMFQLWFERQPTATWRQLIQALKQLQFNYLADQIESKLIMQISEPSSGLFYSMECDL